MQIFHCNVSQALHWFEVVVRQTHAQSDLSLPPQGFGGNETGFVLVHPVRGIVGLCVVQRIDASTVEIVYTAIVPHLRGLHAFKTMISGVMNYYRNETIWLEVHAQNSRALRIYQNLGFHSSGLRKCYYRDGGAALLMTASPPFSSALSA